MGGGPDHPVGGLDQSARSRGVAHNSGTDRALTGLNVLAECLADGLRHTHTLGGCSKQ